MLIPGALLINLVNAKVHTLFKLYLSREEFLC